MLAGSPRLVDGLQGGLAQGIGGAVLEELVYGPDGQLLTASFMDYLLPRLSIPRDQIREALVGNPCRCTGDTTIIDAVERAADLLRRAAAPGCAAESPAAR
jgi:xanthine dehydrogenase molybdopterin-binding subunit B